MLSISSAVRASPVDISQRIPYNPRRTRTKKPDPSTVASPSTLATTLEKRAPKISISDLLKRSISETVPGCNAAKTYERQLPITRGQIISV